MRSRDLSFWMWGDALALLQQADQLHQRFFRSNLAETPCWEPPVDIIEWPDAVVVHVALPGVPSPAISVRFDPDGVHVSGQRRFPAAEAARIHRIEIPYGRFSRRIALPLHSLEPLTPELQDGCLVLAFRKITEAP